MIIEKMKTYIKNNWGLILSILLCVGVMSYFITQKNGFHEDEMFSYGSSNYRYDNVYRPYGYAAFNMDILYNQVLPQNNIKTLFQFIHDSNKNDYTNYDVNEELYQEIPTWKSSKEALEYLRVGSGDVFNYRSVYINQTYDVHPPMFYFAMHLVSTIFYGHFTKYIGFTLNIILFVSSLIMLAKICTKLKMEKLKIPAILMYGLSVGAVSTVSFHRMYMMLTFFGTWYLYLTVKLIKENYEIKNYWPWLICIFAGFLTQYYFSIYVLALFFVNTIYLLAKKDYKKWLKYFICHVGAVVAAILFFPASIYHILFSSRGVSSAGDTSFVNNFNYFLSAIIRMFSLDYFWKFGLIVLVIGVAWYCYSHKKIENKLFLANLIVPIIIYLVAVSLEAPYLGYDYTSRYIMILFPSIALLLTYIFINIFSNKYFYPIFVAAIIGWNIYSYSYNQLVYLYHDYQDVLTLANENADIPFIYVYDNNFTHLSSMPEFTIYKEHLIIDDTKYDYSLLLNDEVIKSTDKVIVCVKNWLNKDEVIQKIIENTDFKDRTVLKEIDGDISSTYYVLNK